MRSGIVIIVIGLAALIAFGASVGAGPRKAIVLPLDGNASAGQKTKLNASIARMAKSGITGTVTIGDATYTDTATAVGCKPEAPACAQTVLNTLGVDELVYGTATTSDGTTTVTVYRVSKNGTPKSQVAAISDTDSGDGAETAIGPLFPMATPGSGSEVGTGSGTGSELGSGSEGSAGSAGSAAGSGTRAHQSFFDTRERKIGFALVGGGTVAVVIGLSLWAGKSGLQDDIDNHPTTTLQDLQDLHDLEDRAGTKALWGNILVIAGLGMGGVGAYYLYKDHKNREAGTTLTPAPVESGTGMTWVLRGRW